MALQCEVCCKRLVRKLYQDEMECDKCAALIPASIKRFMCLEASCAFHRCNRCRASAGSLNAGMSQDASKRSHEPGATPVKDKLVTQDERD
eukprot:1597147-Karenia_brevis.AAC.1